MQRAGESRRQGGAPYSVDCSIFHAAHKRWRLSILPFAFLSTLTFTQATTERRQGTGLPIRFIHSCKSERVDTLHILDFAGTRIPPIILIWQVVFSRATSISRKKTSLS